MGINPMHIERNHDHADLDRRLNKFMTTRFTACAVIMELAEYSKKMELKVLVGWESGCKVTRHPTSEQGMEAIAQACRKTPQGRRPITIWVKKTMSSFC